MGVPLHVVLLCVVAALVLGGVVYVVMAGDVPGFDENHPYEDEPRSHTPTRRERNEH